MTLAISGGSQPASDTTPGLIEVATASEMEAASDTARAVVPAYLHRHPGIAKFWAKITLSGGTPTLAASYNVTSIVDDGAGLCTITIATDFSSAHWCCQVSAERDVTTETVIRIPNIRNATQAAGSVQVEIHTATALVDPGAIHCSGFGDQ